MQKQGFDIKPFTGKLAERFNIEFEKKDRSGIYGYTRRAFAYNSNKIEGSTLTEELIKLYHRHLKSGVFEDMANGYPVGEYKNRKNIVE